MIDKELEQAEPYQNINRNETIISQWSGDVVRGPRDEAGQRRFEPRLEVAVKEY